MQTNRRNFIATSLTGGLAAALPGSVLGKNVNAGIETIYAKLDEILQKPVLKRELFTKATTNFKVWRYGYRSQPSNLPFWTCWDAWLADHWVS